MQFYRREKDAGKVVSEEEGCGASEDFKTKNYELYSSSKEATMNSSS
jgi:hypothetical protein